MVIPFFFILLMGGFHSFSYAEEIDCPSKHHIFLIHGIGGSAGTFGSLRDYLNMTDSCYKTESFEYETGNSHLSTFDFANSFNNYIESKLDSELIKSQDKISLIMHSQGGLVGSLWLNMVKSANPSLFNQLDAFITLSTPFWGSDMASIGKLIFYAPPGQEQNFISPFGKIELNEMSYGSSTIRKLDWILSSLLTKGQVRPLAIGGMKRLNNQFIGEDDAVVPVYSSRPEHYSSLKTESLSQATGVVSAESFIKVAKVPFSLVEAGHIQMEIHGVADIPKKCLISNCAHPSLALILNHLKGLPQSPHKEEKLGQFRVNIFINNQNDESFIPSDLSIKFLETKNVTIPLTQKLHSYRGKASLSSGAAFSFYGTSQGPRVIKLQLSYKKNFQRILEIPVEGGFSSIAQIGLVP